MTIDELKEHGYYSMAVSEGLQFAHSKGEILRNKKTNQFFISVDDCLLGPFMKNQLEVLDHVIRDVLEMMK